MKNNFFRQKCFSWFWFIKEKMADSHRLGAQLTAFENLEHPRFNREKK